MKDYTFKNPVKINHPLADKISVQDSERHYCVPGKSSEIAFFIGKNFQTEIIAEFADYTHVEPELDTRVYSHVPNELIYSFLAKWRV